MEQFAWPAAVVILGLAGMLIFRRALHGFFSRTTSLALWKGKVEARAVPQTPAPKDAAHDLMKIFDNALLVANEEVINADLKKRKLDGQVAAIPALVRHLAAMQIVLHFERVYSSVWGSQLAILQHLSALGATGAPIESLRPFYQQAAATYPPMYQTYRFEEYMDFLGDQMLIDIKKDHAFITLVGREFLKWLIDEGRSLYKGG
ncbi:MAG: hypothetical protein ACREJ4_06295 [Candidatus Methylomirabilaceae bacterium]